MPQLYEYVYMEINLLCILILLFVFHQLESSIEQQAENIALKRVLVSVIAILITDSFWVLTNGGLSGAARYTAPFIMSLYLFLEGVIAFEWLSFVEEKLKLAHTRSRKYRLCIALPLAALFLLAFTSPLTGWMFSYDSLNCYHRGSLFFLQIVFPLFYSAYSAWEILQCTRTCKSRQEREETLSLLSFLILPVAGFLLTLATSGIPIIWPLSAISLLLVFINLQNYRISTDSLTGINNRRQFDKRLNALAADQGSSQPLCLLLMDIDSFKSINDSYGHYEGDRALVETADVLKKLCGDENIFLARYGGDEFAILFPGGSLRAEALKKGIRRAFDARNEKSTAPYRITVSTGVGTYGPGGAASLPGLIMAADEDLYKNKTKKPEK